MWSNSEVTKKKQLNKQIPFFKGKQIQTEITLILLKTTYESVHMLVQRKKI